MPRIVFVLSQDYGELFNAMYFAAGGAFESVLLMPSRMHLANRESLPYPSHPYHSAQELAALVEAAAPDVVVLFSGYLFVINKLLTEKELTELLSAWRARDLPLVTSDPSLGLIPRGDARFQANFAGGAALGAHFRALATEFASAYHVYLAPQGIDVPCPHGSYYNPRCVATEEERSRRATTLATWSAIDAARARWLFILSPEDDALQAAAVGRSRFAELIADRLRDTARAGRQPVLIAPPACLEAVREKAGDLAGLIALSACGYLRFMLLLLDAEYVFYWNQFSASMLARVINRQPIFTFAAGHLVHALADVRALGSRHFYLGKEPARLDVEATLMPEALARLADVERTQLLEPVSAYLAESPTPSQLISNLLAGR